MGGNSKELSAEIASAPAYKGRNFPRNGAAQTHVDPGNVDPGGRDRRRFVGAGLGNEATDSQRRRSSHPRQLGKAGYKFGRVGIRANQYDRESVVGLFHGGGNEERNRVG